MTQNPMYPPQPPGIPGGAGFGYPQQPQEGNGFAIAGLVFSIAGFCVLFVGGVVGTILGIIGLRKTRNPNVGGKGLSIAAIIVGLISLVVSAVIVASISIGGIAFFNSTKQVRATTRTFVQDVVAQNTAAVRTNASPDFTDADMDAQAAILHPLGALTDVTSTQFNFNTLNGKTTCHLSGVATFSGGAATYDIDMVQIGGVWKVTAARFHK